MILRDQLVLVTGGSRGIGKAIARAAAAEGARVVLAARSREELAETSREIARGGRPCAWVACDLGDEAQTRGLFETVAREHGPIDGLVCAAGRLGPVGPIDETDFDELRRTLAVNLVGSALCAALAARAMKPRQKGRIILFSGAGQGPRPNQAAYVSSKGAIWRLAESLGHELAPFGIYVNAIAPGAVNTRFLDELLAAGPAKAGDAVYQEALRQRDQGGAPAEKAAKLALFLLSERSKGLYGKVLSALWDQYESLGDLEEVSRSDLYTLRRVVDPAGGTRVT